MLTTLHINPEGPGEELVNLWNQTFGDDPQEITRFYRHFSEVLEVLAELDENEHIVSAVHFLPVEYRYFRGGWKGSYLYAAMTEKERRGEGIMSRMIWQRLRQGYQRGEEFLCTLPAEEELYEYYGRFGMEPVFVLHRATLTRQQLAERKLTLNIESKASPYYAYSSTFARREYTVVKDKRFVQYTAIDNATGGGIFSSLYAGYFYARPMDEVTIHVKELYLQGDSFPHFASFLLRSFPNAQRFVFDFCPGTCPNGLDFIEIRSGSARLIRLEKTLRSFAAKHRDLEMSFSLEDGIIEENSGDYHVKDGMVRRTDYTGTLMQLTIAQLTRQIMTDNGKGHPYMNMMLD